MRSLYRGRGCCYAPTVVIGNTFVAVLEEDCGNSRATMERDEFLAKLNPQCTPVLSDEQIERIKGFLGYEGECDWLASSTYLRVWDRFAQKWLEIAPNGAMLFVPDYILDELTS